RRPCARGGGRAAREPIGTGGGGGSADPTGGGEGSAGLRYGWRRKADDPERRGEGASAAGAPGPMGHPQGGSGHPSGPDDAPHHDVLPSQWLVRGSEPCPHLANHITSADSLAKLSFTVAHRTLRNYCVTHR